MHVLPAPTATFDELNHLLPSYVPGICSGHKGGMTFHMGMARVLWDVHPFMPQTYGKK